MGAVTHRGRWVPCSQLWGSMCLARESFEDMLAQSCKHGTQIQTAYSSDAGEFSVFTTGFRTPPVVGSISRFNCSCSSTKNT